MWHGTDRRKFLRADYPCMITLRKNVAPAQAVLTHTQDISIGGLQALIGKKIEVTTEVDLEIDLKDTLPNMVVKGIVSRVKEVSSGQEGKPPRYVIGIRFSELSAENRARIQHVVDHLSGKGR